MHISCFFNFERLLKIFKNFHKILVILFLEWKHSRNLLVFLKHIHLSPLYYKRQKETLETNKITQFLPIFCCTTLNELACMVSILILEKIFSMSLAENMFTTFSVPHTRSAVDMSHSLLCLIMKAERAHR